MDTEGNELLLSDILGTDEDTISRAMEVARWRSLEAPVEISLSINASATRPPSRETICSNISLRLM